jgi:RHS repeat-associated protein
MKTTLIRQRTGRLRKDVFTHNDRSELTAATMGDKAFAYDYDNIGNRKTAQEEANDFTYTANALNQYTEITENEVEFAPTFDADGNQTRIKTTTGIWTAVYNALNRPLTFTRENADGTMTVITADYDYMGRRVFKKVETVATDSETGEETHTVVSNHRFLYRGYLQIAALDLTRTTLNELWFITWDPTEPVATRPLAIQKDGTWYTYGIDLPKNITEVYGTDGYIKTAYTYSPYGLVTSTGSVTQPIQWSCEYHDTDLALVYYNYRHYNPLDGRWCERDRQGETADSLNCYSFAKNALISSIDLLGMKRADISACVSLKVELVTKGFWGYDKTEIERGDTLHIRGPFNIIITPEWKESEECRKDKENYFKCFPYSIQAEFTYGKANPRSKTILGLLDRNEIDMGTVVFANGGHSNLAVASGGFYVRGNQLRWSATVKIDIFVLPWDNVRHELEYQVVFDDNIGSLASISHFVKKGSTSK